MLPIRDYNQAEGMAAQGDVIIVPVPAGIKVGRDDEIPPIDGKLILALGEVTGHHHGISIMERVSERFNVVNVDIERLMSEALAGKIDVPRAKMYRDPEAVVAMVKHGALMRADLAVGFLIIDDTTETVTHQEHDGIRMQPGDGETVKPDVCWSGYPAQAGVFYVGRQVESAGAEERRVHD